MASSRKLEPAEFMEEEREAEHSGAEFPNGRPSTKLVIKAHQLQKQQIRRQGQRGRPRDTSPNQRFSNYSDAHQLDRLRMQLKFKRRHLSRVSSISLGAKPQRSVRVKSASETDRARLTEMFKLVDLNKDGLIDFADLNRLFKQLNIFVTRKEVSAMIRAHDPTELGGVTFDNFCAMMTSAKERSTPRDVEMRQIFSALDRNGNGWITRMEAREALKFVETGIGKEDLDAMFETLDTDRDGQISADEFAMVAQLLNSN